MTMQEAEAIQAVRDLVEDVTTEQFRVFAIEALRRWRKKAPSEPRFGMNGGLGREIVPVLAEHKETTVTAEMVQQMKECFYYQQAEPWLQPLVDFLSWLDRAGLAVPLYGMDGRLAGHASAHHLTGAGMAFLDAPQDHPCLPGFIDRVVARCSGLPEEVSVHLVDARTCLDHGLARPSVSLMGLAYEAAENEAIEHLEKHRGLVMDKRARAKQRIAKVVEFIPNLFNGDDEQQGRAREAWDFADRLRDRRNHASHPKAYPDFSDLTEVHEFIVSAGRHLRGLWSVTV